MFMKDTGKLDDSVYLKLGSSSARFIEFVALGGLYVFSIVLMILLFVIPIIYINEAPLFYVFGCPMIAVLYYIFPFQEFSVRFQDCRKGINIDEDKLDL